MVEKRFVIISYYTKNTGYEGEVQRLIESLDKFELPYEIEGIETLGSWVNNVHYNHELILKKMEEHPGKDLVSLDADAVVNKYPALFDTIQCDFAAHLHEWKHGRELFCSTMYIANNEKMRMFFIDCIHRHTRFPHERQQPCVQATLKEWGDDLMFMNLPPQYANIFDLVNVKFPVITQYQASRRFKKEVNRMSAPKIITTRDLKR
jgi:hypothetical protein